MKIMYLVFSFAVGGTERLVTDICNEMCTRNHEIYLYIVNDLVSDDLLATLNPNVNIIRQNRRSGSGEKLKTLYFS